MQLIKLTVILCLPILREMKVGQEVVFYDMLKALLPLWNYVV